MSAWLTTYDGDPDFDRGLAAMRSAGLEPQAAGHTTALLLLPPLALRAGRDPVATAWLERNGFIVEDAKTMTLSADNLARIWKYHRVPYDPVRINTFRLIMTCGQSLLLLVTGHAQSYDSVAARLRDLKGPARPRLLDTHHLRHSLGAANMFNNLAHTSDGPADVVREMAAVLDDRQLAQAWTRIAAAFDGTHRPAVGEMSTLGSTRDRKGVSLPHWATALRHRLIADIAATAPDTAEVLQSVRAHLEWTLLRDSSRPVEVLEDFRSTFPAERPLRSRITCTPGSARLASLVELFDETTAALFTSVFDFERMLHLVRPARFDLDPAERAVLAAEWLSTRHDSKTRTAS